MRPQLAFVVEQDCSTTVPIEDAEEFPSLDIDDNEESKQEWTNGDLTRPAISKDDECSKRGCKISKLRVWKNEETISGFEVVFTYP